MSWWLAVGIADPAYQFIANRSLGEPLWFVEHLFTRLHD